MIVARVFELDRPGVRIRNGRILRGGPFGRTVNIPVSGGRETWWARLIGERVYLLEVRKNRGFQVYAGREDEANHALIFIDPGVDFLFSIEPTVAVSPVIQALWEDDYGAKLLLAPEGAEFSVSIQGVWANGSGGLNHSIGVPVIARRTFYYSVVRGGNVRPSSGS